MSLNSLASYPRDKKGDGSEDEFQLLEQTQFPIIETSLHRDAGCEDNTVTPNTRLPAKALVHRSTTRVVRVAFWTSMMVLLTITILSNLLYHIPHFLPDTSDFDFHNKLSCDLTSGNGSALQNAFTINLRGSAHLSFSAAKAIDVMWQLFVGMGGRLLMAWISYTVFMDGLTRLMEGVPISYDLYASLTFSSMSLYSTWLALKAVYTLKGWKGRAFLFWFAVSSLYILGFPTLMSATAGYLSPSSTGVAMPDGNFLTSDSPELRSCYNVTNGALVGLTNGTIAEGPPVSTYDVMEGLYAGYYGVDNPYRNATHLFSVLYNSKSFQPFYYH